MDITVRTLCVFCGSSDKLVGRFGADARALADRMIDDGISLVYGGGSIGLMGVLADRMIERGGIVTGVIPRFLADRELAHPGIAETVITETMHDRKRIMSERSDAFAVLPGGFGTMDEFFEILTWKQLRLHDRPVVVANTHGWFDPVVAFGRSMREVGAITPRHLTLFSVVPDAPSIIYALKTAAPSFAAPDLRQA